MNTIELTSKNLMFHGHVFEIPSKIQSIFVHAGRIIPMTCRNTQYQ